MYIATLVLGVRQIISPPVDTVSAPFFEDFHATYPRAHYSSAQEAGAPHFSQGLSGSSTVGNAVEDAMVAMKSPGR